MSTSIEKCILVEGINMCEFHLKGNCFHPEKVGTGFIAKECDVHSCNQCTNQTWQNSMIKKDMDYYQTILDLALESRKEIQTPNQFSTNSFEPQNRFKNPFSNLISGKKLKN